jgi:hypothetical protein
LLPPLSGCPDDVGLNFDRRPELLRCIFAAGEHIWIHPKTTSEAIQSLLMHAEKCIKSQGHFEEFT